MCALDDNPLRTGKLLLWWEKERHEVVVQGSAMPITDGVARDDRTRFNGRRIGRQSTQNAHLDNTT